MSNRKPHPTNVNSAQKLNHPCRKFRQLRVFAPKIALITHTFHSHLGEIGSAPSKSAAAGLPVPNHPAAYRTKTRQLGLVIPVIGASAGLSSPVRGCT